VHTSVCNFGTAGSKTVHSLERVEEIKALKPRVVVLLLGANDALAGVSSAEIRENLLNITKSFRSTGIKVVLAGLKAPAEMTEVPSSLQMMGVLYDEVAQTCNGYVPWVLRDVYLAPGRMSADNFHPNREGYRQMAQNLFPTILSVLRDKQTVAVSE
jgi:acyl-CoA thioesterase I